MKNFLFWLVLGWVIVFGYFFVKENPDNIYIIKTRTRINEITTKANIPVGIANPASTYCIENNWTLEIKNETGGQIGFCGFTDGSSCEEWAFFKGECKPGESTKNNNVQENEDTIACTMEYAPVCAKVEIQCIKAPCEPIEQTFGNRCMMEANKLATFLHEGECTVEKKECPQYTPPSPDFCKEGSIENQGTDENGCQLPPKCIIKE